MGVAHFAESMKQDVDYKIKERQDRLLKLEIDVVYNQKAPTGKKAIEYYKAFGYIPNNIYVNPEWKNKVPPKQKYNIRNRPRGRR